MPDLVVTRGGAFFGGRRLPCSVGWGGIGRKRGEGDGVTPLGHFRILSVHYRADRLRRLPGATPIGPGRVWSDDPRDPFYNRMLRHAQPGFGHERMRRGDGQYDVVAVLDFNLPDPVPGAGSAIFLHVWRGPGRPTAGCIAMRRVDLIRLLGQWSGQSRVVVRGGA